MFVLLLVDSGDILFDLLHSQVEPKTHCSHSSHNSLFFAANVYLISVTDFLSWCLPSRQPYYYQRNFSWLRLADRSSLQILRSCVSPNQCYRLLCYHRHVSGRHCLLVIKSRLRKRLFVYFQLWFSQIHRLTFYVAGKKTLMQSIDNLLKVTATAQLFENVTTQMSAKHLSLWLDTLTVVGNRSLQVVDKFIRRSQSVAVKVKVFSAFAIAFATAPATALVPSSPVSARSKRAVQVQYTTVTLWIS